LYGVIGKNAFNAIIPNRAGVPMNREVRAPIGLAASRVIHVVGNDMALPNKYQLS
jgi:hypothetical protein